jgi:hypothetical protein
MPKGHRAQFKGLDRREQMQKKLQVCSKIPKENLDIQSVRAMLVKHGLMGKTDGPIYTIIKRLKGGDEKQVVDLDTIKIVKGAAAKIGGLQSLKNAVLLIEQLQEIK